MIILHDKFMQDDHLGISSARNKLDLNCCISNLGKIMPMIILLLIFKSVDILSVNNLDNSQSKIIDYTDKIRNLSITLTAYFVDFSEDVCTAGTYSHAPRGEQINDQFLVYKPLRSSYTII